MRIEKIEDMMVWSKAKELALIVYKVFKGSKDFSFKDQIQRAVISIMNNIAEGFERGTNKEFIYFLYIAKGSCGEVRSMINVASELNYISKEELKEITFKCEETSKMLSGFIRSIK